MDASNNEGPETKNRWCIWTRKIRVYHAMGYDGSQRQTDDGYQLTRKHDRSTSNTREKTGRFAHEFIFELCWKGEEIWRKNGNMERSLGDQISRLDKRLSLVERGSGGVGHIQTGVSQGGWGPTPTDLKAVIHGFKQEAKEQEVKRTAAKKISETGMKEKHLIDYPAIPLTYVFVEFEDKRIRDRFVRSASMRKYELDERTIKTSEALEPEPRFEKKKLGYIKFAINNSTGIQLHWIKLNLEKRSVFVFGQLEARVENDGFLKYYKYEDEVQKLMDKWLTKN